MHSLFKKENKIKNFTCLNTIYKYSKQHFTRNFYTVILIIILLYTGCNDKGIEVKPVKDPRTYSWTADTIAYPGFFQTLMYDMWGSSPKDVYVVGHASDNDGVMWHFDGNSWIDIKLSVAKGGQIPGAFDLTSIYGFSSTDIYAAGERIIGYNPKPPPTFIDSSLIIHYDGIAWRKVNVFNGRLLGDIYGNSSEIWAGGWEKKLYHYNGSRWETDSINVTVPEGYFFQVSSISSYNSNFYLIGNSTNNNTAESITYFYKRVNNTWTIQDLMTNSSGTKFGDRLNQSSVPNLYSIGSEGIYKYSNSSWDYFFPSTYPINSMWGTSDKNIFAVGNGGRVYHFNGTDWKQIEELNDSQIDYFAVWTEGTEAFVAGSIFADGVQKTIVWHGK